jgi:hypothetical protein
MKSIQVFLTSEEVDQARRAALTHIDYCASIGHHQPGPNPDIFKRAFTGFCGEIGFSKYLRVPWQYKTGSDNSKTGDVKGMEIRTTFLPRGNLILNQRDKPDRVFVLGKIFQDNIIELCGWEYGHNIMVDKYIFYRPQFQEKLWMMHTSQLQDINILLQNLKIAM